MPKKRGRYLYTEEPIPRRTEYRRRLRQRVEEARLAQESSDSDEIGAFNEPHHPLRTSPIAVNQVPQDKPDLESQEKLEERVECQRDVLPELCVNYLNNYNVDLFSDHGNQSIDDCESESANSVRSESTNPLHSDYQEGMESQSENNNISENDVYTATDIDDNSSDIEEVGTAFQENPNIEGYVGNDYGAIPRQGGPELATPLCPCTTTTEGDVLIMCIALAMRHNFSWVAVVDILKMINVCFGADVVSASKYFLFKYMDVGKDEIKFHSFCQSCEKYLGERDSIPEENRCQCEKGEDRHPFYISVNIEHQIKRLLSNPDIANELMTYRFQRQKLRHDAYEDIYDGQYYKILSQDGNILSDPSNFSYSFNTDGLQVSNSSCQSVWPIFLQLNELKPQNRKKHMILAGIWVGKRDPNMRLFLSSFADQANKLSKDGIEWCNHEGVAMISKIIPACVIADSAARYKLMNLSSYHCYFGCTFCYQRAENTVRGRRYPIPKETAPLRTHESILADMALAAENLNNKDKKTRVVKGTKGPSPLVTVPYLNFGSSFVVDYMHSGLLGNTRSHFALLLNSPGKSYYLGSPQTISKLNDRITCIKPPSCITRTPRKFGEVKNWKANEWRSLLLFYCLVVLRGLLQKEYLSHLALLSASFYTLLSPSCTFTDLNKAHTQLLKYIYLMEKNFGKTAMLYNVHLLQHIVKGVIDWGPLFYHSAFEYEGENFHLGEMYTSPGHLAHQLSRRYIMYGALPSLCSSFSSTEKPLKFIQNLTGKHLKCFFRSGDTVFCGRGLPYTLSQEEKNVLTSAGISTNGNCFKFSKFFRNGMRFCTEIYSEGKKYNDAYVCVRSGHIGVIQSILRLQNENQIVDVILMKKLILDRKPIFMTDDITVKHIQRIARIGALSAIRPSDIISQCVYMNLDNGQFITVVPLGCLGND